MNCTVFERNLEAFLADGLAPADKIEMEKHEMDCILCEARLARSKRLDAFLRRGLGTAAAMTPAEQVALRVSVLAAVQKPRTLPRLLWRPHAVRIAAILTLAVVIVVGLALLGRSPLPALSAAELVARAQAAMDEYTGLSGVLHWETGLEQGGVRPDEVLHYRYEIRFDFDDPGRYRLRQEFEDKLFGEMVRDGVDRLWYYVDQPTRPGEDYPAVEGSRYPYVEEIVLSPEEMQDLAAWYVPSPLRADLDSFAGMLPDVRVAGETRMAGRPVYLLEGELFTMRNRSNPDGSPQPVKATVTLAIDAETYWLLGREEKVEGEKEPYITYRTTRFELLAPEQVAEDAFAYTPPQGVEVRRLEGVDSFYHQPRSPAFSLLQAAEAASFVPQVPTTLPDGLEALPLVQLEERQLSEQVTDQELRIVFRGKGGRQMLLVESLLPKGPALAARLVEVGGRQGWLQSDLIDSKQFVILLPNWGEGNPVSLEKWQRAIEEGGEKQPPGTVMLHAWGLSMDEAVAVLESLMPYKP